MNDETSKPEIFSKFETEQFSLDPAVIRTADYLYAASQIDEKIDILFEAREKMSRENAKKLYLTYLKDCMESFKTTEDSKRYKYAKQIDDVALMGLGIWQEDLGLKSSGIKYEIVGEPKWDIIEENINNVILGETFFENISVPNDKELWGDEFPLRMSACDASQHRYKLRTPLNKSWATPVVVNNAAGTIKEKGIEKNKWKHISVPKDTKDYEDWVILGPDDYANLEENDYEWATKSSMDIGQFFVEETFIFRNGGGSSKPDVHFRDGRIFPQDKLMNCRIENRHGQLTREAIYRMYTTCRFADENNILYCGVAKQTNLKIYSSIINWYITKFMEMPNWNPTGTILTDTQLLRYMLNNKDFSGSTFENIYITVPILRSFHTTSNLNRRSRKQVERDKDSLSDIFHNRDLTAKTIIEKALKISVVMFFAGHTTTDEIFIPRYEYMVFENYDKTRTKKSIYKILSALRLAGFDVDEDHLRGLDEPINTLIPSPLLVAHDISKKMGDELGSNFSQKVIAEFLKRIKEY